MGLKALDLSVMLYMTTGFNVRVSHPPSRRDCCDFAGCRVVKYLFVYVWSYRVDKGPNAATGEKESVLQVLDAVAGREPPLTPAAGSKPPAA